MGYYHVRLVAILQNHTSPHQKIEREKKPHSFNQHRVLQRPQLNGYCKKNTYTQYRLNIIIYKYTEIVRDREMEVYLVQLTL